MLIFKDWLTVLANFERVPAGTHVVNLRCIFNRILKPLFVPRREKHQFLKSWKVLALIAQLHFLKKVFRVELLQLSILLKSYCTVNAANHQ